MRGTARTVAGMLFAAVLAGLGHRVLRITQQPSWPPGADAVTSAAAQQAVEAFTARDGAGPRSAALPFAWSTAATIEPWVDGERFFPRVFADVEAARSSVHVLMFGWREGEVGMRMASLLERQARGRARGADHRRRPRLQALRAGARDVRQPRRRRCADRGQRRPAAGPPRPLPARGARLAAGPPRPRRPSEAVRHRRAGRLDRRRGHRGPLRRRPVPRRDGARHRGRRAPGAGRVPDELPRPRRAAGPRPRRASSPSRSSAGRRRSPWRRSSRAGSSRRRWRSGSRSTARASGSTS